MFKHSICLAFLLALPVSANDLLFENADFESGTLEGWTAEGDAFSRQPTRGDNPQARNREGSNHAGDYWIGTYENYDGKSGKKGATRGDGPTGTLTSPEFKVTQPHITFLIGGGHLPSQAGVKIVSAGKEKLLSSGVDSETMVRKSSDVSKFLGKRAKLVVFDHATGGWGHINVDDFRASAEPIQDTSLDFAFTNGISAEAYPDIDYSQPLRPQFHFSSKKNWLNDPNGMVHDGKHYHLFFQHNPKGPKWGNMTWGHATSTDMVHWKQLDHALLPYRVDGRSGTIFSGTAIVDHNNSLGRQVGDTKTLVAFYTFANKPRYYQAMAYSPDGGNSWAYWNEGRAVVDNQGFDTGERDPKVFWHDQSNQWVMFLWVERNPGRVRIFTSPNLTDWTMASDLMRDWAFECMDVVFLPVDGVGNHTKCVVYDASFDYEIGTFDGKEFRTESGQLKAGGGNFYAAQTFNQAPESRVVQIGWMRGGPNSAEVYGLPYNQQMSFPSELTLRTTEDGVRLFTWPVKEIESLVKQTHVQRDVEIAEGDNLISGMKKLDLVDLEIEFDPGSAERVVIELPGVTTTYDVKKQVLTHSGVKEDGSPREFTTFDKLAPRNGIVQLRFLVDRLSIESYAFAGERFRSNYYSPKIGSGKQSIRAEGGGARVKELTIRELTSAW